VRVAPASAVVLVTAREPDEALYRALVGERKEAENMLAGPDGAFPSLQRIGDCLQPALIVHAVYSGHRAARELGGTGSDPRRERVRI